MIPCKIIMCSYNFGTPIELVIPMLPKVHRQAKVFSKQYQNLMQKYFCAKIELI